MSVMAFIDVRPIQWSHVIHHFSCVNPVGWVDQGNPTDSAIDASAAWRK
ncbi:MAG: hypothetical protein RID53_35690 [Coleofasciculus sp. B1-GNL1-01]